MTPWPKANNRFLRRHYPHRRAAWIASKLRQPVSSVYFRAYKLGLHKSAKFRRDLLAEFLSMRCPGGRLWTAKEDAFLRRDYANRLTKEIAAKLHRSVTAVYHRAVKTLGLRKSEAFLSSPMSGRTAHGSTIGLAGRKGLSPWNKGLRRPGWFRGRMRETQFKKGQRSRNYLPIGTIRTDSRGYLRVKIADGLGGTGNQKAWAFVHKQVWEAAHGPIPPGHRIWWKDRDHANCKLENLELLSDKEHMARTTIHATRPPELKEAIYALIALKRKITMEGKKHGREEEHTHRSAEPPIRHARRAARSGETNGHRARQGHR